MTDYTSWHVGMKVVCVDARPADPFGKTNLVRGAIYTITALFIVSRGYSDEGKIGLELAEVKPAIEGKGGFKPERFRPVQPRKTDISIFKAMLHTSPVSRPRKEPVQHDIFGDA